MEKLSNVTQKRPSRLSALIKTAVSALLIAALLYKSDLNQYVELIKNSSPVYLLVALVLTVASIVLSAYKWQLLVMAQGFTVPLRSLTSSYFVGLFFNNFMPTSIGGDVVRVYDLRKMIADGPAAAASVVAERVLAAFTLGLIVLGGVLVSADSVARYKPLIIVFVLLCTLLLLAVLSAHRFGAVLARFESSVVRKLKETADSMRVCVDHKPTLVQVLIYSLVFQLTVVAINIFIIKALGLTVPYGFVLLFIPIISAITMLPISLNGLGVREAMYVYFFSQVGLSTEESITISIFFFIIVTLVSLIGGIIFAVRK
ncbi:MAG TPA: lysylphosphatidylglycerol synthase transmembrane domain-containing protein [Candidatus Aquicultor sp.]